MTTIREDDFSVVLINTSYVKPEKAEELVELLTKATDHVLRHEPGFISANLYISLDKPECLTARSGGPRKILDGCKRTPKSRPT